MRRKCARVYVYIEVLKNQYLLATVYSPTADQDELILEPPPPQTAAGSVMYLYSTCRKVPRTRKNLCHAKYE